MTSRNRSIRGAALVVLAASLAACTGSDESELRAWMEETRKTMKVQAEPIPEPKQFAPYAYSGKSMLDPFDAQRFRTQLAENFAIEPQPSLEKLLAAMKGGKHFMGMRDAEAFALLDRGRRLLLGGRGGLPARRRHAEKRHGAESDDTKGVRETGDGRHELDYRTGISRSALSRPTRAHQPMFDGSVSVVFAGVSPTE